MELLVVIIGTIILCVICSTFRVVPENTAIIIDRNSHYHKTVKHGIYFFNPAIDKVTTLISTKPYSKGYTEIFETGDSRFISVSYLATYSVENVDNTLRYLEESRRSVDDVLNCAFYTIYRNNDYIDIASKNIADINGQILAKAKLDVSSLAIDLHDIKFYAIRECSSSMSSKKFVPHISDSAGAVKYC